MYLTRLTTTDGLSCHEDEIQFSDVEGLKFMREEEKLARDVYLTLGNLYNSLKIFENINSTFRIVHGRYD